MPERKGYKDYTSWFSDGSFYKTTFRADFLYLMFIFMEISKVYAELISYFNLVQFFKNKVKFSKVYPF
jgi:hypothetical protein